MNSSTSIPSYLTSNPINLNEFYRNWNSAVQNYPDSTNLFQLYDVLLNQLKTHELIGLICKPDTQNLIKSIINNENNELIEISIIPCGIFLIKILLTLDNNLNYYESYLLEYNSENILSPTDIQRYRDDLIDYINEFFILLCKKVSNFLSSIYLNDINNENLFSFIDSSSPSIINTTTSTNSTSSTTNSSIKKYTKELKKISQLFSILFSLVSRVENNLNEWISSILNDISPQTRSTLGSILNKDQLNENNEVVLLLPLCSLILETLFNNKYIEENSANPSTSNRPSSSVSSSSSSSNNNPSSSSTTPVVMNNLFFILELIKLESHHNNSLENLPFFSLINSFYLFILSFHTSPSLSSISSPISSSYYFFSFFSNTFPKSSSLELINEWICFYLLPLYHEVTYQKDKFYLYSNLIYYLQNSSIISIDNIYSNQFLYEKMLKDSENKKNEINSKNILSSYLLPPINSFQLVSASFNRHSLIISKIPSLLLNETLYILNNYDEYSAQINEGSLYENIWIFWSYEEFLSITLNLLRFVNPIESLVGEENFELLNQYLKDNYHTDLSALPSSPSTSESVFYSSPFFTNLLNNISSNISNFHYFSILKIFIQYNKINLILKNNSTSYNNLLSLLNNFNLILFNHSHLYEKNFFYCILLKKLIQVHHHLPLLNDFRGVISYSPSLISYLIIEFSIKMNENQNNFLDFFLTSLINFILNLLKLYEDLLLPIPSYIFKEMGISFPDEKETNNDKEDNSSNDRVSDKLDGSLAAALAMSGINFNEEIKNDLNTFNEFSLENLAQYEDILSSNEDQNQIVLSFLWKRVYQYFTSSSNYPLFSPTNSIYPLFSSNNSNNMLFSFFPFQRVSYYSNGIRSINVIQYLIKEFLLENQEYHSIIPLVSSNLEENNCSNTSISECSLTPSKSLVEGLLRRDYHYILSYYLQLSELSTLILQLYLQQSVKLKISSYNTSSSSSSAFSASSSSILQLFKYLSNRFYQVPYDLIENQSKLSHKIDRSTVENSLITLLLHHSLSSNEIIARIDYLQGLIAYNFDQITTSSTSNSLSIYFSPNFIVFFSIFITYYLPYYINYSLYISNSTSSNSPLFYSRNSSLKLLNLEENFSIKSLLSLFSNRLRKILKILKNLIENNNKYVQYIDQLIGERSVGFINTNNITKLNNNLLNIYDNNMNLFSSYQLYDIIHLLTDILSSVLINIQDDIQKTTEEIKNDLSNIPSSPSSSSHGNYFNENFDDNNTNNYLIYDLLTDIYSSFYEFIFNLEENLIYSELFSSMSHNSIINHNKNYSLSIVNNDTNKILEDFNQIINNIEKEQEKGESEYPDENDQSLNTLKNYSLISLNPLIIQKLWLISKHSRSLLNFPSKFSLSSHHLEIILYTYLYSTSNWNIKDSVKNSIQYLLFVEKIKKIFSFIQQLEETTVNFNFSDPSLSSSFQDIYDSSSSIYDKNLVSSSNFFQNYLNQLHTKSKNYLQYRDEVVERCWNHFLYLNNLINQGLFSQFSSLTKDSSSFISVIPNYSDVEAICYDFFYAYVISSTSSSSSSSSFLLLALELINLKKKLNLRKNTNLKTENNLLNMLEEESSETKYKKFASLLSTIIPSPSLLSNSSSSTISIMNSSSYQTGRKYISSLLNLPSTYSSSTTSLHYEEISGTNDILNLSLVIEKVNPISNEVSFRLKMINNTLIKIPFFNIKILINHNQKYTLHQLLTNSFSSVSPSPTVTPLHNNVELNTNLLDSSNAEILQNNLDGLEYMMPNTLLERSFSIKFFSFSSFSIQIRIVYPELSRNHPSINPSANQSSSSSTSLSDTSSSFPLSNNSSDSNLFPFKLTKYSSIGKRNNLYHLSHYELTSNYSSSLNLLIDSSKFFVSPFYFLLPYGFGLLNSVKYYKKRIQNELYTKDYDLYDEYEMNFISNYLKSYLIDEKKVENHSENIKENFSACFNLLKEKRKLVSNIMCSSSFQLYTYTKAHWNVFLAQYIRLQQKSSITLSVYIPILLEPFEYFEFSKITNYQEKLLKIKEIIKISIINSLKTSINSLSTSSLSSLMISLGLDSISFPSTTSTLSVSGDLMKHSLCGWALQTMWGEEINIHLSLNYDELKKNQLNTEGVNQMSINNDRNDLLNSFQYDVNEDSNFYSYLFHGEITIRTSSRECLDTLQSATFDSLLDFISGSSLVLNN